MKEIPLTQGQVALVDDEDYEAVSQFKWHARKAGRKFYAARQVQRPDGKWTTQYLHRFLMPGVSEVDHRDGDGLNNSRENRRAVTHSQNMQAARRKGPDTTSNFRGVGWSKRDSRWRARIAVNDKDIYLGNFKSEIDAAKAYDKAARKYFGEYASLNFP